MPRPDYTAAAAQTHGGLVLPLLLLQGNIEVTTVHQTQQFLRWRLQIVSWVHGDVAILLPCSSCLTSCNDSAIALILISRSMLYAGCQGAEAARLEGGRQIMD